MNYPGLSLVMLCLLPSLLPGQQPAWVGPPPQELNDLNEPVAAKPDPALKNEPKSSPVPAPPEPLPSPRESSWRDSFANWGWRDWTLAAVVCAMAIGIAYIQFFVLPRQRRQPLVDALALFEQNSRTGWSDAELLLTGVLTAGLSRKDVAIARFSLAYARTQLARYNDAATVIADIPENERDRETIYLDLYIQSKRADHQRVEAIWNKEGETVADLLQAKLIVAITYIERARNYWASKQIASAVEYFRKLRLLGQLLDEIPDHLDDHHIVLGVTSLFEQNFDRADKSFQHAKEAAEEAGKPTQMARLGLLLCEWRRSKEPLIDEPVGALAAELSDSIPEGGELGEAICPECKHPFRVAERLKGRRVTCHGCRRAFLVPPDLSPVGKKTIDSVVHDLLLGDDELLLRNVRLWHAATLLFEWRQLPEMEPLAEEQLDELRQRLAMVHRLDPTFSDGELIGGLLDYSFAADEEQQQGAIKRLEKAVELGVHLPEIVNLIAREKKLEEYRKKSLERFYTHVQDYLGNRAVPEQFRHSLRKRLARFQRGRELFDATAAGNDEETTPSLSDLHNRSQLLRDRVRRIQRRLIDVDPAGEEARAVDDLVGNLEKNTLDLMENARRVETVEHDLMATTSEFLLHDEEGESPIVDKGDINGKEETGQGSPAGQVAGGQVPNAGKK